MMGTVTLSLTDFLLARIAEDQAVAQQTQRDAEYHYPDGVPAAKEPWVLNPWDDEDGAVVHIDPARVLAECEAKRLIIRYREGLGNPKTLTDRAIFPSMTVPVDRVLKILASVYRDHPDFKPEWSA